MKKTVEELMGLEKVMMQKREEEQVKSLKY